MPPIWSTPVCEHIPAFIRGPPAPDLIASLITRRETSPITRSQTADSQPVTANSAQPRATIPVSINQAKPLSKAERRLLSEQYRRDQIRIRKEKRNRKANKTEKIAEMLSGHSTQGNSQGSQSVLAVEASTPTACVPQAPFGFGQPSAVQSTTAHPFTRQPCSELASSGQPVFGQPSFVAVSTGQPPTHRFTFGQPSFNLSTRECLSLVPAPRVPAVETAGAMTQDTTVYEANVVVPAIEGSSDTGDVVKRLQDQLIALQEQKASEIAELQRKLVSLHETKAAELKEHDRQLQCKAQSVQTFVRQSRDERERALSLQMALDRHKSKIEELENAREDDKRYISRLQDGQVDDQREWKKLDAHCYDCEKEIKRLDDQHAEDKRTIKSLQHYIDHAQDELNNFLASEDALMGFVDVLRLKRRGQSHRVLRQPGQPSQKGNRPFSNADSDKRGKKKNLITTFVRDAISQAHAEGVSASGALAERYRASSSPSNPIDLTLDD